MSFLGENNKAPIASHAPVVDQRLSCFDRAGGKLAAEGTGVLANVPSLFLCALGIRPGRNSAPRSKLCCVMVLRSPMIAFCGVSSEVSCKCSFFQHLRGVPRKH